MTNDETPDSLPDRVQQLEDQVYGKVHRKSENRIPLQKLNGKTHEVDAERRAEAQDAEKIAHEAIQRAFSEKRRPKSDAKRDRKDLSPVAKAGAQKPKK